jgi:erythromycin esterase-like protein
MNAARGSARHFVELIALLVCVAAGCATAAQPAGSQSAAVDAVRAAAEPLRGGPADYDTLLQLVGNNRFVLLGESTHGTLEFYRERARLTRRLIEERGFTVVVIEADWQDTYDVNEFAHGRGPASVDEALRTYERFPTWMWGNTEFRDLVAWMRHYNATEAGRRRPVGVYGMDVYGVDEAMADVLAFTKAHGAATYARAEQRYRCFERYRRRSMELYGQDVLSGRTRSCAEPAAAQFQELGELVSQQSDQRPGDERLFSAWQNARVVMNGEAYYRTALTGGVASWNLRDRHMADTIDALSSHLGPNESEPAKLLVWAHNSHLGDARMTERTEIGELNVGQLMRQRHDGLTVIVGFTTYEGTVRAANTWGGPDEERALRPALRDSFSALFHAIGLDAFLLRLRGNPGLQEALAGRRPQRFVGVIYMPATERRSHYFDTDLAHQYDAVIHIDRTTALPALPMAERRP